MKIHVVQKGDTLWEIAEKYHVSYEALIEANPQLSSPDMIMPGMKVKVPADSKAVKTKQMKKTSPSVEKPYKDTSPAPKPVIKEDDHEKPKHVEPEMPFLKPLEKPSLEMPDMYTVPQHSEMPDMQEHYQKPVSQPQQQMPQMMPQQPVHQVNCPPPQHHGMMQPNICMCCGQPQHMQPAMPMPQSDCGCHSKQHTPATPQHYMPQQNYGPMPGMNQGMMPQGNYGEMPAPDHHNMNTWQNPAMQHTYPPMQQGNMPMSPYPAPLAILWHMVIEQTRTKQVMSKYN
ncbi:Spore coat assembly protein ExsA [Lentibacillus sp. JNUCC-1]|uniref:SafA/ExsA family spore coat assembly protein n=1 Tax=Lentibacillus sp. JNUCC-1 TaxID=2654513 RepID=UPI0012E98E7F|nr:SafA/ExsA family spore coat assembly protein [Lentibacillus sp. JNUCC-1]MUV39511.1 Spore coat assembly protein ExsA [Lentibacillus sp. JNUCC-1]